MSKCTHISMRRVRVGFTQNAYRSQIKSISRVSLFTPNMSTYHLPERECVWSLSNVVALKVEIEDNLEFDTKKPKQNSRALISWLL